MEVRSSFQIREEKQKAKRIKRDSIIYKFMITLTHQLNKFGLFLEISLIIIGLIQFIINLLEFNLLEIILSIFTILIGILALRLNLRGGIKIKIDE
jgi:hypothetical protein